MGESLAGQNARWLGPRQGETGDFIAPRLHLHLMAALDGEAGIL